VTNSFHVRAARAAAGLDAGYLVGPDKRRYLNEFATGWALEMAIETMVDPGPRQGRRDGRLRRGRKTFAGATCTGCGRSAMRVHIRYERRLSDVALAGQPVQIRIRVRRFFCHQVRCPTGRSRGNS
jgi:hypothetical protein